MSTLSPEDHAAFARRARRLSPTLARTIAALEPIGFPARRHRDLATSLSRIVVGQQLSTHAAQAIWTRLETAAAARHLALLALFTAEHAEVLRRCGLSAAKIRTLQGIHGAAGDGRISARTLARLAHDARQRVLCSIWGIGRWTADMVSLFHFRDPDIWPEGDLTVRNTFARYVDAQTKFTMQEAAALFAPRRSYLALYLWRIADREP